MKQYRFAICIKNDGYEASLQFRKVYNVLEDLDAEPKPSSPGRPRPSRDRFSAGSVAALRTASSIDSIFSSRTYLANNRGKDPYARGCVLVSRNSPSAASASESVQKLTQGRDTQVSLCPGSINSPLSIIASTSARARASFAASASTMAVNRDSSASGAQNGSPGR